MGYAPIRFAPQLESLDNETRLAIWNRLFVAFEAMQKRRDTADHLQESLKRVWRLPLQRSVEDYRYTTCRRACETVVMDAPWHEVLTLLEILVESVELEAPELGLAFGAVLNEDVLSKHLVGYRFIGAVLTPITSDVETDVVNEALGNGTLNDTARSHLQNSVKLLSDRDNPNYRKAMAEAIDAVESAVHALTGETVLSKGLKRINRGEEGLHPALASAWEKMYSWASDEGVRHADFGTAPKDQALATYVVVTSSAFLNYLASADNITIKE